jgi:CHAT domain-containing protein
VTTRLATVLDQIESALSRGDAREMTAAFAQAARMMPQENAGGLREHYRSICGLSDAARERGLVLAALPLMQAFEDTVAASGQFSRLDADDLLMGRAIFENEGGQFAVAVLSLERLLSRANIEPFTEAVATLALGASYAAIGDRRAVATLRKGLGRIARIVPPGAPEIARAKLDLARAAMEMEGRVPEAETLVREALPLVDHAPGILPAFARDVLGRALQLQGKYDEARRCFEEALAIVQQRVDPAHPVLFAALANLGTMYFAQGDYLAGERLLEEAYGHVVKTLGDDPPAAVPLLLGLANARIETGDHAGADRLLSRALKTLQARPNDSPPQALGFVLGRLGSIALRRDDLAAARSHFEEAARLLAGTAFETIPLGALARIRIRTGDPAGAERDIRRRIEYLTGAGLAQSGEGAFAWLDLALARLAQCEWSHAIVHVDTAIGILETVLGSTYPDIALCLQTRVCAQIGLRDFDGVAASLDRIRRIEQRQLVESLAVMAASRRAALLERMRNSLALTISAHLDYAPFDPACETAARALLITRKGLSGEAARQRFEALRRRLSADEQKLLDQYSGILQQLSAHLVEPDPQLSETARANLTLALNEEKEAIERALPAALLQPHLGAEPTAHAIASRLAPGDAFIDYVFYQSIDPVRQQPIAGTATGYGAYWVASDGTCGATRIGSGPAIKDLVERFHRAINEEDSEEVSNAAVDGYRMLLASLPEHVAHASRLCISPDGMLYLLPFAALMREPGAPLLQTATITYVDSARDLLAPPPAPTPRERTAVVGDPDYYANVGNLRSEQMEDVPDGEAELMALREVLPRARFWTRAEATKQRLMSLHGPIVLHVITHGALYERDEMQDLAMAQSAIALAGYNDADRGIRDGALTGLEASLLDLGGCELVTLSACDTGRGRIDAGQGVLGLRRGLQIAGTRSQLVTLWPVVGETTARFMTHFYRALADSLPREEAMRNAQLAIAKEFDDWPLFWAPFVLFGAHGRIDAGSL